MKRFSLFLFFALFIFAGIAGAQTATPIEIDETLIVAILGVLGIGVVGLTEMITRLLKTTGVGSYLVSLVVSAGATALTLVQASKFTIVAFAIYTALVFLEANGIAKRLK